MDPVVPLVHCPFRQTIPNPILIPAIDNSEELIGWIISQRRVNVVENHRNNLFWYKQLPTTRLPLLLLRIVKSSLALSVGRSVFRPLIPDLPGTPTTALGKGSKLNLQRREHCPLVLIKLTNSMGNSSSRPRWNSIETTQHNTIAIASPGVTHIVYCMPSYLTRALFCSS